MLIKIFWPGLHTILSSSRVTIYAIVMFILFTNQSLADSYKVRALGGIGKTRTDIDLPNKNNDNKHFVTQFMVSIGNDPKERGWGIEIGKILAFETPNKEFEFNNIGVIVETNLYKDFVGQLGTIGYIDTNDSTNKLFGFRLSFGMDRSFSSIYFYSLRFRQDYIFDTETISAASLEAGFGISF